MSDDPVIVLKFGGSVLTDESTLRLAVHEIYRWRRNRYRVVAVVSALSGKTDSLLESCRRINDRASASAVAAVVAGGEMQSAALLALHLDRAGVPASLLAPAAIGLTAEGPPLDASPVRLDPAPLIRDLRRFGVVVVPGFVAQDADGRTCLLGRGGSDLTALCLADRLQGRCRMIKDVDGLYDRDPAAEGPTPHRYDLATWQDALATDGSIVQHKAVRFAACHGIEFELGCFNGRHPTHIGRGPTRFGRPENPRRQWRIALLGRGTVGSGVHELFVQLGDLVELTHVTVMNLEKHRAAGIPPRLLTTDPMAAVANNADLVVEAIGGVGIAGQAVEAALKTGAHVVTANKWLVAERGRQLRDLAQRHGRRFCYSAAVGGAMPLLEWFPTKPRFGCSMRAVLNGTTNFVIDRVAAGDDFAAAVQKAQSLGLAEADPSRDLSGQDAADKLAVLLDTVGIRDLPPQSIPVESLTEDSLRAALRLRAPGSMLRHIATLENRNGTPTASVRLLAIDAENPLAGVSDESNGALIEWEDGCEFLHGKGAGRWPTAEAIIADVLEIMREEDGMGTMD